MTLGDGIMRVSSQHSYTFQPNSFLWCKRMQGAISRSCVCTYTCPDFTKFCYNMRLVSPKLQLPQNPALLASDEKIALIYTRGCTCLQRSTGPHARNVMKLFSPLLLRVTKHI